MQTTIDTALAPHVRNITFYLKQFAGKREIPTLIQSCNERSGHHLSSAHLALLIFMVVMAFEHIVSQSTYCYNLAVNVFLRHKFSLVTFNFIRDTWSLLSCYLKVAT